MATVKDPITGQMGDIGAQNQATFEQDVLGAQQRAERLANKTQATQQNIVNRAPVSPLTSSDLESSSSFKFAQQEPAVAAVGLQGQIEQGLSDFEKTQKLEADRLGKQRQSSLDELTSFVAGTPGQTELTAQAEKETGVNKIKEELNSINDQLRQEQNALRKQSERILTEPGLTKAQANQRVQEVERKSLSKQADLAIIQQSIQGRFDSARQIAEQKVNIQMEQDERKFQALTLTYNENKELFTKAEQRAFEASKSRMESEVQNKRDTLTAVNNLAIEAAKGGATSDIVSRISSSKDIGSAIGLAGKYLVDKQLVDVGGRKKMIDSNGNVIADLGSSLSIDQQITLSEGGYKLDNAGNVIGVGDVSLGNQVGTIAGLPSYDTYSNNPGMTRSNRNNNPGNIKISDYTKGFDGVIGVESRSAADGGNFIIFDSAASGINAIGRLLQEGRSYQGVTAEQAIKKYNGGGAYGASSVGLDPNKDFQSQIKDPVKLQEVAYKIALAEGYKPTQMTQKVESETVNGWVDLINKGQATVSNVPDSDGKVKDLKNKVAVALAKSTSTQASPQAEAAKQKITLIESLVNNKGIKTAVGTTRILGIDIAEAPARVLINKLTGSNQNFIAGVQQLVSQDTLQTLLDLKAGGGTLGALSDQERIMLQSAATKIGTWAIRDKNGNVVGYNASEKDFKAELERIKQLAAKAVVASNPNYMVSQDDINEVDNIYGTSGTTTSSFNPANFYIII